MSQQQQPSTSSSSNPSPQKPGEASSANTQPGPSFSQGKATPIEIPSNKTFRRSSGKFEKTFGKSHKNRTQRPASETRDRETSERASKKRKSIGDRLTSSPYYVTDDLVTFERMQARLNAVPTGVKPSVPESSVKKAGPKKPATPQDSEAASEGEEEDTSSSEEGEDPAPSGEEDVQQEGLNAESNSNANVDEEIEYHGPTPDIDADMDDFDLQEPQPTQPEEEELTPKKAPSKPEKRKSSKGKKKETVPSSQSEPELNNFDSDDDEDGETFFPNYEAAGKVGSTSMSINQRKTHQLSTNWSLVNSSSEMGVFWDDHLHMLRGLTFVRAKEINVKNNLNAYVALMGSNIEYSFHTIVSGLNFITDGMKGSGNYDFKRVSDTTGKWARVTFETAELQELAVKQRVVVNSQARTALLIAPVRNNPFKTRKIIIKDLVPYFADEYVDKIFDATERALKVLGNFTVVEAIVVKSGITSDLQFTIQAGDNKAAKAIAKAIDQSSLPSMVYKDPSSGKKKTFVMSKASFCKFCTSTGHRETECPWCSADFKTYHGFDLRVQYKPNNDVAKNQQQPTQQQPQQSSSKRKRNKKKNGPKPIAEPEPEVEEEPEPEPEPEAPKKVAGKKRKGGPNVDN